jgi:AP2 domain
MEYDGFTPGFRSSFRPIGLDAIDSYVSVTELLSSPSKAVKRSLFMDFDTSGQYLQGYSPSRKKSRELRRDSPSNFFGTSDIASYIAGTAALRHDEGDETYLESLLTASSGPTPDLTTSSNVVLPTKSRSRSDSAATQSSEFRSGCRGVSWNRRMKAWLAFWTEGKVRRSKTFNTKCLGFERARDAAIEFLISKKAHLQAQGNPILEDSQSGGSMCSSEDIISADDIHKTSLNLFDDHFQTTSPWGMEDVRPPMRL